MQFHATEFVKIVLEHPTFPATQARASHLSFECTDRDLVSPSPKTSIQSWLAPITSCRNVDFQYYHRGCLGRCSR